MNTYFVHFIANQAYFGKFPTQSEVDYLEKNFGIDIFIDLTEKSEREIYSMDYICTCQRVYYPIVDVDTPRQEEDIKFHNFVHQISDELSKGKKYIFIAKEDMVDRAY